jgi:DedD protein
MHDQDTEITLGTGKLLGLFFMLAVLCGVFFVIGYSFGRNTASAASKISPFPATVVPSSTAVKPAAADVQPDCTRSAAGCASPITTARALTPNAASDVTVPSTPAVAASASSTAATARKAAAPESARPAPPAAGYLVQVAAISKRQDAEALQAALRRKQYQVFITVPETDSLFHVQIGPFAERKDADAMRQRLVGDGYTPIVK